MKNFNEMLNLLSSYSEMDLEEVYVDERYVNTPYLKIEDLFEETIEVAKSLNKEEATKLIVRLMKTVETNVKSRFSILCDFRESYAIQSAQSAENLFNALTVLEKVDFQNFVTTEPQKIIKIITKSKAMVAQFMTTPRTLVVYDRKADYFPDQNQTTVSASKIVEFDPLTLSVGSSEVWKKRLIDHAAGTEIPTQEEFKKYISDHRMLKEYIKNEPKSKNMYKRKGFDKTFTYIKEAKQSKMTGLIVGSVILLGILYFVFFA